MGDKLVVGCGYLGRAVAALWRAQGHLVYATTRRQERFAELRALGLEPVACDVLDPASVRALPPAESALYCVGFDRAAGRSLEEVYVEGLANFLAHGPAVGRLLYVSSTGVYGQAQGEEVDETSATEPEEEPGRVGVRAEATLRAHRPDAVVLRFAGLYGPGRLIGAAALRSGQPLPGDADGWLNLIHVEDGAAAVLAAEARGAAGAVYNVSDGRPVRRRDFYERLAELLGAAPPRFGQAAPGQANRRVSNARLVRELGVELRYPSYEEGLTASR